tara:strand:+ start:116 stop:457 length:342 start_codon:yes stop_codon:yes gene_type:complete
MSVKLTLLKSGETLISDMQELVADKEQQEPHAYILNNPHVVKSVKKDFLTEEEKDQNKFGINVSMIPWIILSADKKILLPVDCVMTIVEPIEGVKKMFLDKCETFSIKEELND